jgi:hypothetical protein
MSSVGSWVDGLAEWTEGDTAFISVAFSWKVSEAYSRAAWFRATGYHVRAGGPGLFTPKAQERLGAIAELGGAIPDALRHHNPMATKASEGCPVGCHFCIVPAMEGRTFTLLPDFPVRPVLTDNNLSALPADYQQHIVERYRLSKVKLLDANSGFEPATFDEEVFERWQPINKGPWRFAYDESRERDDVYRVTQMLRQRGVGARRMQVYVLIGNEPFDACMGRIREVIEWGGEPYVQPVMKLNAETRDPWVRFDWTDQLLREVQRWSRPIIRRKTPNFADYDAGAKTIRDPEAGRQMEFAA